MARLPIVGGDAGNWGTILNEYLQVSHNGDGTLKTSAITGSVDANARVAVAKGGTLAGTRRRLNFIEGTNVTIAAADDAANEKVDITISASGTGSGLADPGGNGIVARTASNTTAARTLTGASTNQVIIADGDGVAGNPTFSLPQDINTFSVPTFGGMYVNGLMYQTFQSAGTWSSGLSVRKRGTTGDANAAVTAGSEIGYHQFEAWDGTAYGRAAYVVVNAAQNFGAGAHGARYAIFTTANGAADSSERMRINETGVMLGGADPTHTLTLPYSGSGIAIYNTGDQTTNYERGLISWNANTFTIATQNGGTGTARNLTISAANELRLGGTGITYIGDGSSGNVSLMGDATNTQVLFEGTQSSSDTAQTPVHIKPTISQSGTAGYAALLINPTELSTGSGTKWLIRAQRNGSDKFLVTNAGSIMVADAATLTVGTATGTKIGTATNQKLGFFNATPVVQPSGSVISALSALGLVASPTIAAGDVTSGTLAVTNGGTGAATAAAARTNLAVAEASGYAKMTVSTTAPTSPAVGDLWVDTN